MAITTKLQNIHVEVTFHSPHSAKLIISNLHALTCAPHHASPSISSWETPAWVNGKLNSQAGVAAKAFKH